MRLVWQSPVFPWVNAFLLQRSAGWDALGRELHPYKHFLKLKIMRHSRVPSALLRPLSFKQRISEKRYNQDLGWPDLHR